VLNSRRQLGRRGEGGKGLVKSARKLRTRAASSSADWMFSFEGKGLVEQFIVTAFCGGIFLARGSVIAKAEYNK